MTTRTSFTTKVPAPITTIVPSTKVPITRIPGLQAIQPVTQAAIKQINSDNFVAVIVEPREHIHLEYVILNIIENIPENVQVILFHGKSARNYIKNTKLEEFIKTKKIKLEALDVDNLRASDYNKLFATVEFWNKIPKEVILIFQTDSVLCGQSDFKLTDFGKYDYIGSNWVYYAGGLGGNGGLSIRRKSKMISCINDHYKKYYDMWKVKTNMAPLGEDWFFIKCINENTGIVADKEATYKFGAQNNWKGHKCFGCHKPNLIPKDEQKGFLKYCPEAKRLIN
jgi:hypothetical protein